MRFITIISLLTSLVSFGLPAELFLQDEAQKSARALELLSQARAALGGEKVMSISIGGTYRQLMGEREIGGELELEMLLPDKFLKSTVTSMMAGMEITRQEALNGENAWIDTQNSAPAGGHVMIRMGGPGGGANSAEAQKAQQTFIRQEWTRLLLGLLGQPPPSVKLECSYLGEAEAPDGLADVLTVKSPAIGLDAQLFLDQKTHRPLMLSYQGRKPRVAMITRSLAPGADPKKQSPEEVEKAIKEAQAKAAAEPLVEIQLRFEDYRSEGGIILPHRISRTIDGQINEEWELTKFKINPALKADKFEKK
jgi:hypothetical protein